MLMKNWIIIAGLALIIVLGGWYFLAGESPQASAPASSFRPDSSPSEAPAMNLPPANPSATNLPVASPSASPLQGAVLGVSRSSELGEFLVAPNGMTLYIFTKDTSGTSNCYDECAANWPPYTVSSADGLREDTRKEGREDNRGDDDIEKNISTTRRKDGMLQVTYNGKPLYYWSKDQKPGDTTGQNVGGVWFVLKP